MKKIIGQLLIPAAALATLLMADIAPGHPEVTRMAAVAILMAGWWITEAIPIPITSLLPIALFPLLGILDGRTTAATYFNHLIFLFIGGFLFAIAMQRWDLHRRIALRILRFLGTRPTRVLLGFMCSTWFLSMWISNTAATMMMVPMAMAIIGPFREHLDKQEARRFSIVLVLGVAYAASIGGISTQIGTPPNMSLARILEINFPGMDELTFAWWFRFAFPLSLTFMLIAWFALLKIARLSGINASIDKNYFHLQYQQLGKVTYEQRAIGGLFLLLIFGWMFRSKWSQLFPHPKYIDDGTVAIIIAILLFLIPSRKNPGEKLMDWTAAKEIRWGIILMFGGGFALATGFIESGLSESLGEQLTSLQNVPLWILTTIICTVITFLTELTSNMATTEVVLPILAAMAKAIGVNPLVLMIPATLSASCAFMLPVATAPNAIAFGSGEIKIKDMIRYGFILNIIGIVLISAAAQLLHI
ncbi:MAG: sodium:dicarboxylate symporter [Planctomycetes bacterium]|nr:sodium:dicarboxylate symporter [Planctomycetota bacterium]